MLVQGWGTANSTDATPYWIVKVCSVHDLSKTITQCVKSFRSSNIIPCHVQNSWGVDWGMGGYFYIVRGSNECAIESTAASVFPEV